MEHHKKVHNGKNRQTGRKVLPRKSGQNKTKVTGRVVGKRIAMPTLPRPKPRCCQTPEQRQVLNERMFAELSTIRWDREWSEVRGTWKRVIPFATSWQSTADTCLTSELTYGSAWNNRFQSPLG